ncbi:Ig-like domain-containing protein [Pantoea endophytica]
MKHNLASQGDATGRFIEKSLEDDRSLKFKDVEWKSLDTRSFSWSEGSNQLNAFNQSHGITNLHGLVVHGAACASLLALGSMAAVGRESSYELLLAKAMPHVPPTEYIARWPATFTMPAEQQDAFIASPEDPLSQASGFAVEDVLLSDALTTTQTEALIRPASSTDAAVLEDATKAVFAQLDVGTEPLPTRVYGENMMLNEIKISFSFSLLNQQHESVLDSPLTENDVPIFTGMAEPYTLIEVIDPQGNVIGSSVAEESGHWHISLPSPLLKGDYDFSLITTGTDGVRVVAVESIKLVVVFPAVVDDGADPITAVPIVTAVPLIESVESINLMPVISVVAEPSVVAESLLENSLAFGLSELLPALTSDVFFNAPEIDLVEALNDSTLQALIHPEGEMTVWQLTDDHLLNELEYSPALSANALDSLYLDLLNENIH